MTPLVSILIPAYHSQRWIAETLRSALNQTWPRKEIVVVDDGSADATLEIARRFASPEVRVVTQPQSGAAAARNRAFELCQGDYIQWLDADDLLAPDKIERQMDSLSRCETSRPLLASAWGRFLTRPDRARFVPTVLWRDLSPMEWMLLKMEHGAYMQTTAWLVSRELAEAAGPWDTRLTVDDDGEYFCRVVLAGSEVLFAPGARTYYRAAGTGSLSQISLSRERMASQLLSVELNVARVRALDDSPRVRAACVAYLKKYMPCFDPDDPELMERARRIAASAGGTLPLPRLPWKYAWIGATLGWKAARKTQARCSRLRGAMLRALHA